MAEEEKSKVRLRRGFKAKRSIMDYQKCRIMANELTRTKNGANHADILTLCLVSKDKLAPK